MDVQKSSFGTSWLLSCWVSACSEEVNNLGASTQRSSWAHLGNSFQLIKSIWKPESKCNVFCRGMAPATWSKLDNRSEEVKEKYSRDLQGMRAIQKW